MSKANVPGSSTERPDNHQVVDIFDLDNPNTEEQLYYEKPSSSLSNTPGKKQTVKDHHRSAVGHCMHCLQGHATSLVDFHPNNETESCWKPDWEDTVLPPVDLDETELKFPEPFLTMPDDDTGPLHSDNTFRHFINVTETVPDSSVPAVSLFQPDWQSPDDHDFQVVPTAASDSGWKSGSSQSSSGYVDSDTEDLVETGCLAMLDQYVPNYVPEE